MTFSDFTVTLAREIAAVKLNKSDGTVGPLYRIPAHSQVRRVRPSQMAGMVEIDWQGEGYAVFEEDLRVRGIVTRENEGFYSRGFAPALQN